MRNTSATQNKARSAYQGKDASTACHRPPGRAQHGYPYCKQQQGKKRLKKEKQQERQGARYEMREGRP
jgi:hypothetical protein